MDYFPQQLMQQLLGWLLKQSKLESADAIVTRAVSACSTHEAASPSIPQPGWCREWRRYKDVLGDAGSPSYARAAQSLAAELG
eukprot:SAG11_NODE_26679_length_342_cov_0.839506_1_plen_82_part_10